MTKQALMIVVLSMAIGVAPALLTGRSAASGCEKDTDCKGDRICKDGSCRDPNDKKDDSESKEQKGLPHYCCTPAGKLGPYANPQNGVAVKEGEACFGTTSGGQRANGTACY